MHVRVLWSPPADQQVRIRSDPLQDVSLYIGVPYSKNMAEENLFRVCLNYCGRCLVAEMRVEGKEVGIATKC